MPALPPSSRQRLFRRAAGLEQHHRYFARRGDGCFLQTLARSEPHSPCLERRESAPPGYQDVCRLEQQRAHRGVTALRDPA